jgi:hypothetical protein
MNKWYDSRDFIWWLLLAFSYDWKYYLNFLPQFFRLFVKTKVKIKGMNIASIFFSVLFHIINLKTNRFFFSFSLNCWSTLHLSFCFLVNNLFQNIIIINNFFFFFFKYANTTDSMYVLIVTTQKSSKTNFFLLTLFYIMRYMWNE